ncbi:cold-shock protein [Zhengella mangrovi]|uniref:Cold-shock protein n=2 Tax=Zhengella mangrovi TaxID=1982044 RepID=A0A2G1QHA4_9HYPH|nr:cold shock domain-containing protein [Zhengella mangrovi]PHP64618.1 cold-shock protein [Zhengella mangrovi]
MCKGTVKHYDGRKGVGIVIPDNGGKDLIIDIKALDRAGLGSPAIGQTLEFDVETDRHGREFAVSLRLT